MSTGRRSSTRGKDPEDIVTVDPGQPEASRRAPKHLTKKQKAVFVQWGFTKALLREVICDSGWDQVDINNYVLRYNGMVNPGESPSCAGLGSGYEKVHPDCYSG